MGPHLDVDYEDMESLRDPFRMARRFARVIAADTGEPFAWGLYIKESQARPAVCAVELLPAGFHVDGRTDQWTGSAP